MEPKGMYYARLRDWWNDSIVPLCVNAPPVSSAAAASPAHQSSLASETQPLTVLAVSHSASIATLILAILIGEGRYTSLVPIDSRRLHNTSITEVQFRVRKDGKGAETTLPAITRFGDIDHLLRPRVRNEKRPVAERANADLEESM
jgi:broad specificity phosphatase PhoE